MTCDERRDSIFLYAAGELEPDEREAARAHLAAGCPRCAGVLAEAGGVLALLPMALPPMQPAAATREKLMARITAMPATPTGVSAAPRAATSSQAPSVRTGRYSIGSLVASSGLAAALFAVVTGVAVWQASRGHTDRLRSDLSVATADKANLQREVATANADRARVQDQLALLNAEKLQLVSLAVPEGKGTATGRVFWDVDGKRWHVRVFNLKPLPTGKAYQLWAIPDGGKPIPMETFTVDASGKGSLSQEVPAGTAAIKVAAITDEPAGGSPQPTGTIQLAGEVK